MTSWPADGRDRVEVVSAVLRRTRPPRGARGCAGRSRRASTMSMPPRMSVMPGDGAVWPAMVRYGSVILTVCPPRSMTPPTSNTMMRGPGVSTAAPNDPGPDARERRHAHDLAAASARRLRGPALRAGKRRQVSGAGDGAAKQQRCRQRAAMVRSERSDLRTTHELPSSDGRRPTRPPTPGPHDCK